jgi:CDP-diglyceride synthetase
MFTKRLMSSIILLIITIGAVLTGGNLLFAVVLLISLIGQFELYRAMKIENTVAAGIGYLSGIVYDLLIYFRREDMISMLIIIFFMLLMICYVVAFPKFNSEQITMIFFGLFYVTMMLSYIYRVRMFRDGILIVWMIFIGAWGSDTFAYCTGMLIGKHKLPSKLSPKKSIEGCIGGIVGAALLGFLYAVICGSKIKGVVNPLLSFAIMGAAASIISQIGDLTASAIKRNHDIKDYGKLIPGHGGILDRFDSIIFTAPIVFLLVQIF